MHAVKVNKNKEYHSFNIGDFRFLFFFFFRFLLNFGFVASVFSKFFTMTIHTITFDFRLKTKTEQNMFDFWQTLILENHSPYRLSFT